MVASVSSIYGLGSPDDYREMMVALERGGHDRPRRDADASWSTSSTSGTTSAFERGKFRVRGDCVEIWPSYEEYAFRIELWGDEVDQLSLINPTSGETIAAQDQLFIYPAKHFVMPEERIEQAVALIKQELEEQLEKFRQEGQAARSPAAERPHAVRHRNAAGRRASVRASRTTAGRCRAARPGEPPDTLYELLSRRFPAVRRRIARHGSADPRDVSPAIRAARRTLVEHGFRLPSALDNRPLKFEEWEAAASARSCSSRRRPSDYELEQTGGEVVEQIIRPTGLLDPDHRSRAGPQPGACICWSRSASGRRSASGCWSPR